MNDTVKLEVDTSNIPSGWKIPENHSKLTVAPPNCYLLNCNVPPMILNVENANDSIALSNLIVKGNLAEQSACITRLKNSQLKIDFSDNVIDVGDINLFACGTVKYNPNMLLQVELNTNDGSLAPQNQIVMNTFNPSVPENINPPFKHESVLPYSLSVSDPEQVEQIEPTKCLKCGICDKEFTDEDDLKVHTNAHSQRTKSRRCDYCELTFPSKGKWYTHFKTHFNDPSFDCAFCNHTFVTEKYLEEHLKFHAAKSTQTTNNAEERTFPCTFCDKEFPDRAGVLFHLRIHTSDVVFRCMYCGKMFLNKSELNLHVRTHTGDKAHVCKLCKKTFLTTSNLKQHLRIHTGDKPFCCTLCLKTFSNKSNLMQHIKVHTGEKPYRCTYCEKSFTTTSNLTQHLRTHTGIKPYVCDECGKAFINKSNLSQHRKVHRSTQQKEEDEEN